MKLRTHVNLIVGSLSAVFMMLVVVIEVDGTRRAVREEITSANTVATQLLSRVAATYEQAGHTPLLEFLRQLGRVRANEITLLDRQGRVLYRSPAAIYKAGRDAPRWFAKLLLPPASTRVFALADGTRLTVEPNASRAVVDGWDDIRELLFKGAVIFAVLNLLVFWLVGNAVAALPVIAKGLRRIEKGDLTYRLPPMRGQELGTIGEAFNRMALAVQDKWQAERKAHEAEARLEERRELAQLIEQRLEEERRLIARELHDEFAQSVTAIRSLALAIAGNVQVTEMRTLEASRLIASEAARLYDAMHGLIPRLAPPSLDTVGLAETLAELVKDWQARHPTLKLSLHQHLPMQLGTSVTLTIYRTVQEALINALRHAQPSNVMVDVNGCADRITVRIIDDGIGLPEDWSRPGHFGLRGLRERIQKLEGTLRIGNREPRGVELIAEIPLGANP